MIARTLTGLARAGLRLLVSLWPLWLFWGALRLSLWLWREGVLLSADMDRASAEYAFVYAAWPSVGLLGPILLMLIALALHRQGLATHATALASLGGVVLALALTLRPAWDDLALRAGRVPPLELLGGVPTPYLAALVVGLIGLGIGIRLLTGETLGMGGQSGTGHGPLTEQWGREGARSWIESTAWRLYAAVQDPETARALSQACGEHGVMATSEGDTRGTSGRWGGARSASVGRSANRSEIRRALIKPDELLQDTRADEAFVIARGHKPLRCGRAIYFRRPEMRAAVEPSRFQPASGTKAAE